MTDPTTTDVLESELQFYGEKIAPFLKEVPDIMKENFISAMICTTEGFNVCSAGFDSGDIAKMAAVSSSLFAMAKSVLVAFSNNKDSVVNIVTINSPDMDVLGKKIVLPNGKILVLIIASKQEKTGVQLYTASSVEKKLMASFAE